MARGLACTTRPYLHRIGHRFFAQPTPSYAHNLTSSKQNVINVATAAQTAAAKAEVAITMEQSSPTKPKSARPVETRKSQMIRTYTSMLRTTPLILFFQHSNLTANEWAAVHRELSKALDAVPLLTLPLGTAPLNLGSEIKLQVLRTNMLKVALKVVEFYSPERAAKLPTTLRSTRGPLVHDLSQAAYDTMKTVVPHTKSAYVQMEPLMVGPLAGVLLPAVSPAHVAAALSILSPAPGKFPAPTRKKNPGWHEPVCQNGLAKLTLIGARIEGSVLDETGVGWIGGIHGGKDGLHAELVAMLYGAGLHITTTLECSSKVLWASLESRHTQLEEEKKKKEITTT